MAKELNVPVLCCAQLSRKVVDTKDKKPVLSDLRDSGSIEQDADIVIFLHRASYWETDNNSSESNICEVIVAKNRHGSLGTIKMGWNPTITRFSVLDNIQEEP